MTQEEIEQNGGYGCIAEMTVVVDTDYHEFDDETGTFPSSYDGQPQNDTAKNRIIYQGATDEDYLLLWSGADNPG